jgi:hypothetical protein
MGSEYSTEAEVPAVGRSVSASAGTNTVTGSSNASSNDDSCHSIQRAACNTHHHTTGGVQHTPALKRAQESGQLERMTAAPRPIEL